MKIMPVITMLNQREDFPVGAYCEVDSDYRGALLKEYVGKCLFESEANGYHDSDFYMTVWDDETNAPRKVLFASTRGWCYPCYGSSADATDEVKAKYQAWQDAQMEKARQNGRDRYAKVLRKRRKMLLNAATEFGLTLDQRLKLQNLRHAVTPKTFELLLKLFGKRIRSKFKLSLRDQVVNWAKDDSNQYPKPLSPRQMNYL